MDNELRRRMLEAAEKRARGDQITPAHENANMYADISHTTHSMHDNPTPPFAITEKHQQKKQNEFPDDNDLVHQMANMMTDTQDSRAAQICRGCHGREYMDSELAKNIMKNPHRELRAEVCLNFDPNDGRANSPKRVSTLTNQSMVCVLADAAAIILRRGCDHANIDVFVRGEHTPLPVDVIIDAKNIESAMFR